MRGSKTLQFIANLNRMKQVAITWEQKKLIDEKNLIKVEAKLDLIMYNSEGGGYINEETKVEVQFGESQKETTLEIEEAWRL
jgi:hypothetical protein